MKNFVNEFIKGGIAVHCEKEEQAKKFLEILEENSDLTWASGHKPTDFNPWDFYGSTTCFEVQMDVHLLYCELPYFVERNFKIVKFEELAGVC